MFDSLMGYFGWYAYMSVILTVLYIIIGIAIIVMVVAKWMAYTRMGLPGWAAIIPFYNRVVLYNMYYGSGWKFIYEWIPIYGLYVRVALGLRIAKSFNEDGGFGWGLGLFGIVFWDILGFNKDTFEGPVSDVAGRWLRGVIRDAMKEDEDGYSVETDPIRVAWKAEQEKKAADEAARQAAFQAQQAAFQAQQQAQQWQGGPQPGGPVLGPQPGAPQGPQPGQWQGGPQPGGPVAPPPAPGAPVICPQCGTQNDAGATFCVNCGQRLG